MPRYSFIQMSKLPNLKKCIGYIANSDRQENLFAIYDTADTEFWTCLAREYRQEFKQCSTEGKPSEEKKPPERRNILEKLRRIRDETQKPLKRSYRDRDE